MDYRQLGRSGLKVSALTLGTMTFGGKGSFAKTGNTDPAGARRQIDMCMDAGINLYDTADVYSTGLSEEILGEAVSDRRDRLLIATKARFPMGKDPNDRGLSRHHLVRACEASLRRLKTDYIDLYQLHEWDGLTPLEETLAALDDLVRSGKIHYAGICNTPAWRVAQMQAIADLRGWSPFVALQIEYSLVERTVEHELIPMAAALGMGVLPWSPLGGGVLTGKYARSDVADSGDAAVAPTRKGVIASSGHLTARSIGIAETVRAVADEIGATPSQVAIAWTLANPAVTSPILGARTVAQAEDNLGALDLALSPEHIERLDRASAPEPIFPARFVGRPMVRQLIFGGASVASVASAGRRG